VEQLAVGQVKTERSFTTEDAEEHRGKQGKTFCHRFALMSTILRSKPKKANGNWPSQKRKIFTTEDAEGHRGSTAAAYIFAQMHPINRQHNSQVVPAVSTDEVQLL
jgi:hypothetical protein